MVKNLLAMREIRVQSLGQGDPLEKEMATHPSILAWPNRDEDAGSWSQFTTHARSTLNPVRTHATLRHVRAAHTHAHACTCAPGFFTRIFLTVPLSGQKGLKTLI